MKVVSVQVPQFKDMLEIFGGGVIEKAKESGQLIIKHVGDIDIPKADIVVWTHPGPIPREYIGEEPREETNNHPYPPTRYEHLIEYSADDGIVIIETEFERYLDDFKNDFHFRELLPPSEASNTSYLLPSQMPFPGQLLTAIYKRENSSSWAERVLHDSLELAWAGKPNINMSATSSSVEMSELPISDFPRLSAMLDALIESKIRQGKKRKDIVVCVAAHGVFTQTIRLLLEKGVKVVSREKGGYHDLIEAEEDELTVAINAGRLHLSDVDLFDEARHNYDIKIWEHPHGLSLDEIVDGVAEDGLIVIQTGSPQIYIAGLKESGEWIEIFAKPVNNVDYMVQSAASKLIDGNGANVSVFRRVP